MKILLPIFLFLTSINSFACECSELHKNNVEEFKSEVDYIIIGTVIDQLNPEKIEYLDYSWKKEKEAYDIVVKIKKVIKGNIQSDTLYITQLISGNCSRKFSAGKDYIFTGKEIKKFINIHYKTDKNLESKTDSISKGETIPIVAMENPPPPEHKIDEGVLYSEFQDVHKWNSLLKTHKMIWTDQCYSYEMDSEIGQLLFE